MAQSDAPVASLAQASFRLRPCEAFATLSVPTHDAAKL